MTIKNSTRLIAVLLTFAMMLTFASCNMFKGSGSLTLESFIVDPTSVKTEYVIGEEIDFSGIKATAKYNDETLNKVYTFAELTITYADDITATAGSKKVTVSFMDPNLNVKQEATVTITVTAAAPGVTDPITDPVTDPTTDPVTDPTTDPVTDPTTDPVTDPTTDPVTDPTTDPVDPPVTEPAEVYEVVEFGKPQELVHFDSANNEAGQIAYGQSGFQAQFAVGGQTYVIGNENAFNLLPGFAIWSDAADDVVDMKNFFMDVTLSVKKDGAYVELTKKAKGNNVVEYYDGDVLVATVDVYKGSYQFAADAANKEVKISVFPSATHYISDGIKPIVLEAKVINAYNVYKASDLAVIDNYNAEWADFKATHGLTNVTASGIVLHKDIHLSADDVPQNFFYTTTAPVVYKNSSTGAETVIPAGTRYLKDGIMIYEHRGAGNFVMEGNFFTLDTKGFPLVPSPGVFGKDAGRDYGVDFSNAALFRFLVVEAATEEVATIAVNNMSLIGNSARDNMIDSLESLASAGGLIFFKSSVGAITTMDNIIGNSYFITYFTENKTTLNVTNSKCFDSYQNAAFIWADSTFNLINSYVNGCGGPAIIAQSVWDENRHPIVNTTGTVLETHLSGQEIWFTAVNASTIVGQMQAIGSGLHQAGLGNFVDANGKMNIMGALMAKGSSAADIVTGIGAQGSIFVDGKGIDRTQSAENINWMTIKAISEGALAMSGSMPPFFTVYGADGTTYTVYYNGVGFVDLAGNAFNPYGDPTHAAIAGAFMQANKIILTQGGLSVVFEFYHY